MGTRYVFRTLSGGTNSYWDGEMGWSSSLATAYAMTADEASSLFATALAQPSAFGGFVLVRILIV